MFGKKWQPARGTVVAVHTVKTTGDGMVSIHEYAVDVAADGVDPFRAKVSEPRVAMNFKSPEVGDVVAVELDPKSKDVRFDKSDPALSWKAFKAAQDSAFDQTLEQGPEA
jgi:hypothetical protein